MSAAEHFAHLARLLECESEAEARQLVERVRRMPPAQAEMTGHSLVDLSVRDRDFVRVAFDDPPEEDGPGTLYRLDVAPDEAARLRQRQALARAAAAKRDRLAELRAVLLGEAAPEFAPEQQEPPLNEALNESQ